MDYTLFVPRSIAIPRWLVLLNAILVLLIILIIGTNGVRGTDQHLYFADVETLMRGGPPESNLYYPGKILRESGGQATPNYFLHNGLMLHVVAAIGKNPGAYKTWIGLNLVFHCLVALVVLLVSLKVVSSTVSYWVTAIYLVSPIAIWQTLNVLQEQYFAAITALILLGYINRETLSGKAILLASLFIGLLSHPMFIVVGFLMATYGFYQSIKKQSLPALVIAFGLLISIILAPALNDWLFPSVFQPDLKAIITGSVPGVSHMLWHYSEIQVTINSGLLFDKIAALYKAHLGELRLQPMYIFTNIALVGLVGLWFFRYVKYKPILIPLTILFGLYIGMCVLMHPQPRFQQIVSCATFVTIALCVQECLVVVRYKILHLAFACSIVVAFAMAWHIRDQANDEFIKMAKISSMVSSINTNAKIVTFDVPLPMKFSQSVKPRPVLSLMTDYLDTSSIDKVLELFSPEYAVSAKPVDRRSYILVDIIDDPLNGLLYLYKIWDIRITESL